MAEFIDSSSYNNSLIQKFLCLGLWDQFSVNVQRNVAPIYLGYQAFIGELDERLSITVYYEFVDRVRLYLYQDKDFAWKISVVWSSWSLNAGIIELLTTKRLSKQPLKLYQFYTTRIKKKIWWQDQRHSWAITASFKRELKRVMWEDPMNGGIEGRFQSPFEKTLALIWFWRAWTRSSAVKALLQEQVFWPFLCQLQSH